MLDDKLTYIATLNNGHRYAVLWPNSGGEIVFTKGKGVQISAEMKPYLETSAVDQLMVDEGYGERSYRTRCKFSFEPITKPAA